MLFIIFFFLKLDQFVRFREEDKMIQKARKNGVFFVKTFYDALEEG